MSNIGRVDQAVLQLRAQLQRLAKDRAQRQTPSAKAEPRPLQRLREAGPGAGDEEFRRKFVRAILTEELGEALANQSEFERISTEVWRVLDSDPETKALMDEAIAQLGIGAT